MAIPKDSSAKEQQPEPIVGDKRVFGQSLIVSSVEDPGIEHSKIARTDEPGEEAK